MTTDKKIGYGFNFAADLGNGRQVSFMTNFAEGATTEEINKEVDKLRAVVDRQQAKSASVGVAQEIERDEVRLEDAKKDLTRIDELYGAKATGPNTQEKQQRVAAVINIEKMTDGVAYKKSYLAKLLKEAE